MFKKFFNVFNKATKLPQRQEDAPNQMTAPDNSYQVLSAKKLLDTPLRLQYIKTIWQNVSMSPEMFDRFYRSPIEKFAEFVQLLPASESHHHSHLGGMLDHGLEVVSIATKLRQNHVLPSNAAPEEQAKQRDIWTAAIVYAALLHDIGKIVVDMEIILEDGKRWFPWQGKPITYKFRYLKERDYSLHPVLGNLFIPYLLPTEAINWISSYPEVFAKLMYFGSGHMDKAEILAEIIQKSDQISVAMALGGDIKKLDDKPKVSFAKQLHMALQQVIQSFKLNAPKGGGDGWLTEDGLWVMSKTTADRIRGYLIEQGISAPSQNGRIFDELQAHNLIEKNDDGSGIWSAKVKSNMGWAPPKPFSFLKINPTIIWDSIEKRPPLFEGSVIPLANEITMSNDSTDELDKKDVVKPKLENQPETDIQDKNDSFDYALSLFTPIDDSNQEILSKNTNSKEEVIETNNLSQNYKEENAPKRDISVINGCEFINWIKAGIMSGKLIWNRPNAKLHIVEKHVFLVTPGLFNIYLQELGIATDDKQQLDLLQKQFQELDIHKRRYTKDDSFNIWKCSVVGPHRQSKLNGYLIEDTKMLFGDKILINNQWLKLERGDSK